MAGQEGLGRVFNVVPIASGVAVNLTNSSGVTFVCTGADTFTVTTSNAFAGSYATPGNFITHFYQAAATNGTAVYTKQSQAASNAVVQGSAYTTVITYLEDMGPAGQDYVKCTASASGLVTAIVHDLTVQRGPANLPKLSA